MFQRLIRQFKKIKEEGSFARHVSITSSWNIFNFLAQFILSPIITRLYAPEQYGIFAIFNSIVLNVAMVSSLRYNETIIVTDGRKQLNNSIFLSFLLVAIVSTISLFAIFFFHNSILIFLGAPWLGFWVYAIPVSVFLSGLVEIILFINVRRKKFFNNGFAGFLVNVMSRFFTIGFGYILVPTVRGLIGGDFVGKIFGILGMLISFKKIREKSVAFFETISIKSMIAVARIYRHFPLYNLPTNVLSNLSGHVPIFFFQYQYSSAIVGSYALASSLLEIANRLIPYSISSVFFPKAMEMKRNSVSHLMDGVYRLFLVMVAGAVIIFTGVALLAPSLFPWVFGEGWVLAGTFTAILSLQYAFGFVSLAISEVYKVVGQQRMLLAFTIFSVGLKMIAVVASVYLKLDEKFALLAYSLAGAIGNMAQAFGIFWILRYKFWKVGFALIAMMAFLLFVTYFVNF